VSIPSVQLLTTPVADSTDPSTFAARANTNFTELNDVLESINAAAVEMNNTAAALIAANLPSLTGQEGNFIRVDSAGTDVEFAAPMSHFRNKVINGQMTVWQRGTSTSNGFCADRWRGITGAGATNTFSRVELIPANQQTIPGNPRYALSWARGTAGTAPSFLRQSIEGVRTLANETVTLTAWIQATATTEIGLDYTQSFGDGGSASSDVFTVHPDVNTITTGYAKYSWTFTIPSIVGKTIDGDDDNFSFRFRWADDAPNPTTTVRITNVSLVENQAEQEILEVDEENLHRIDDLEWNLCLRYYAGNVLAAGSGYASGASEDDACYISVNLATVMRKTPTLTYNRSGSTNVNTAAPPLGAEFISNKGVTFSPRSLGSGRTYWHGNINFDAELP